MSEQLDGRHFLENLKEGEEFEFRALNEVEVFNVTRRATGQVEEHYSCILSDNRYTMWSCAWFLIDGINCALEPNGFKLELVAIYDPNGKLMPEASASEMTYIETADMIESFVLVAKKL